MPSPTAERRPVGRPPRISKEAIIDAANEVGLEGLTLRSVADHLGVSIAALYHHVSSKDDLVRLAAVSSAAKVPVPEDSGQHWAVWLYEWALYNRDAFTREPALLEHYIDGAITGDAIVGRQEAQLRVLVRQGFSVDEAATAYEQVSAFAIGVAVGMLRARQAAQASGAHAPEPPNDEFPLACELAAVRATTPTASFHDRVTTLLCGIAVRRGTDPAEVLTRVQDAARPDGRVVRRAHALRPA